MLNDRHFLGASSGGGMRAGQGSGAGLFLICGKRIWGPQVRAALLEEVT